ncbi:MAG: hypothetical protein RPU61_04735 [Candidatus Sedimenticola sp. (ex Thyasira tokunagai)]
MDKDIIFISTPTGGTSHFYDLLKKAFDKSKPILVGVDWAKGNGMIRGEIIKRDGNVTHVRFKTVCV